MAIRRTGSQTIINRGVTAAAATPVNIITGSGGAGATVNISSIQIANSTFVAKDDLAIDTVGGYMIINGTGFQSGAVVYIQGTAATSTSFVSSSRLNVTVPALSSGVLDVYVVNTDGSGSIYLQSLNANGTPSWTTTSPLTTQDDGAAFAINLVASGAAGDGTITYAVSSGSSLPSGTFLASNGYFYGTVSGIEADTTYSFSIDAIDAQNQDTARTFNITVRSGDANYKDTVLLLNGETSNNTWINDASTNGFALTVNGDTRPVAFSPYETVWSNYFDGTGNYLRTAYSDPAFTFGTNNLTIECWIYQSDAQNALTNVAVLNQGQSSGQAAMSVGLFKGAARTISLYASGGGGYTVAITGNVPSDQWVHVAGTRSGSTWTLWINGVSAGTGTYSGTVPQETTGVYGGINIGHLLTVYPYSGYISNVRIVNGTAVYTSAFTPPTAPLTAITNTSLLTCQSNRLIDNSTNNFTLTRNGDVSVSNFGPFVETDITTGSGYFDGTGDYLTVLDDASLESFTDFTIEFWVYFNSISGTQAIVDKGWNNASIAPYLIFQTDGNMLIYASSNGSTWDVIGGSSFGTFVTARWYHIALTRSGSSIRLFRDGSLITTATNSSTIWNNSSALGIGGSPSSGANPLNGYISDVRIIKGTAVYTEAFTPPTAPLTAITNTSLLTLQSRIGENNNRFVDSSGLNNIITRNGNATQGTFSPFQRGGWSNFFDGTGDSLSCSTGTELSFGTGDYTIEVWVNASVISDARCVFFTRPASGYTHILRYAGSTLWQLYYPGGTISYTFNSSNNALNQWTHHAIVRNSGVLKWYINGVEVFSTSNSTNVTDTYIEIGNYANYFWNGYISNLRIVKGTAVYTEAFTPPTTPLTAVANTSLLTCADSGFVDDSPNNFAITKVGDVSVQPFSPFKPHTITTNTYSVYFDGTDDYLSIADSANLQLGSGDFTAEGWFNPFPTKTGSVVCFYTKGINTTGGIIFGVSSDHIFCRHTGTTDLIFNSGTGTNSNQWIHVAWVRNGNQLTIYRNGVSVASASVSFNQNDTSVAQIGSVASVASATNRFGGYASNFRIVKGTAVYTEAFTPPTSPLTAIENTSLLTCQSSSIIDNSNTAFAITVNGDARATTVNPNGFTVSGPSAEYSIIDEGGSMYFDGTGDYLATADKVGLRPETSNFTLEGWIYRGVAGAAHTVYAKGGASTGILLQVTSTNVLRFTHTTTNIDSTITIPAKSWTHVAVVRSGTSTNQTKLYINGVFAAQGTVSTNFTQTEETRVGTNRAAGENFNGYMSGLRFLKGTALYTSGFVPPAAPPTPIAGSTLLLNGTNGGVFDYTRKNNLETVGNVQLRNNVTKYGNTSMYFDGTGDYAYTRYSPDLDFGTGNFTVEFWMNPSNTNAAYRGIVGKPDLSVIRKGWVLFQNAGTIRYFTNGTGESIVTSSCLTAGSWTHIALVKNGSTTTIYANGTSVGTATNVGYTEALKGVAIGEMNSTVGWNATFSYTGYIDDLRITKGVARYTSNFTVPNKQHSTN